MITKYEFFKLFEGVFALMARNGMSQDDAIYVEPYKEYLKAAIEGQKEAEIRVFLQKKYKLSASTLKRVINEFSEGMDLSLCNEWAEEQKKRAKQKRAGSLPPGKEPQQRKGE